MRNIVFEFKLRRELRRNFGLMLEATYDILPEYYDEVFDLMNDHDVVAAMAVIDQVLHTYFRALNLLNQSLPKEEDPQAQEVIAELFESTQLPRVQLVNRWHEASKVYFGDWQVSLLLGRYNIKFQKKV